MGEEKTNFLWGKNSVIILILGHIHKLNLSCTYKLNSFISLFLRLMVHLE